MIQRGKSIYENYSLNKSLIESVKAAKIEYIIAGHCHCDHIGLIPALYSKGCKADIIVPTGSSLILKEMWLDSAFINQRDADILTAQREKLYYPLFTDEDVYTALDYIHEVDFHEITQLDSDISLRYSYAGHILLSAQTELYISKGNHTKKILFTSDLGNLMLKDSKPFVEQFEPIASANIVIGEATYASSQRIMSKKDLSLDIEKIRTVIDQYCNDQHGTVLIPCFALDRLPYMIWILYSIFSSDISSKFPILIDSPLGIRLLQAYKKLLSGSPVGEKLEAILSWDRLKFIEDSEDSKAAIADGKPKVVLSSSGMLTAGRSVKWAQSIISKHNCCFLFIGYTATNSLASRIKNYKDNKTIVINGKECRNNAGIVDLHGFSSHMQHEDLLKYYSGINAEKIYLVHSDQENKAEFKAELEKRIEKNCRTTKVVAVNRSTKITV